MVDHLDRSGPGTLAQRAAYCRSQALWYDRWWHFGMWERECQEYMRQAREWDRLASIQAEVERIEAKL